MDPRAVGQLLESGLAHHRAGRLPEAESAYRKVLAAHPENIDALHLLGVLAGQCGKPAGGLPLLQRAVALGPGHAEFHRHLAETLAALGRHPEAGAAFARALHLAPRDAASHTAAGIWLLSVGRADDAIGSLAEAARLNPQDATALGNHGHALSCAGRTDEALAVLRRAIEVDPHCGVAWIQLAEALWRAHRYDEAVEPARRGAELAGSDVRSHVVHGNALHTAGELEAAGAAYRRAIELDPNNFDAHSNLALVLLKTGEARQALARYDQILTRWPGTRDALANRSLALLTLGELQQGWADYEARWSPETFNLHRRLGRPWDGGDARGQTVLLISEQGFGDTIQFARYARLAADRGATVVVSCPAEVEPVIRTAPGVSRTIRSGERTEITFHAFAPMASLPRIIGTTLATIPADVPYVSADAERVRRWRDRLAADANVRVGLVWAGSAAHQNDKVRSCALADLAPLAAVEGVTFYSLQKGAAVAQLAAPPPGLTVTPLGDELKDFGDTAALLECLDLLIAVDTSVVHLAGALARPVWTLLARGPDWRWMLGRDDSPWYPTMRLFRQQALKEWRPVIERVATELRGFVRAHRGGAAQQERT